MQDRVSHCPASPTLMIITADFHLYIAFEFRDVRLNEPPQLEPELFFNRQSSLTLPRIALDLN